MSNVVKDGVVAFDYENKVVVNFSGKKFICENEDHAKWLYNFLSAGLLEACIETILILGAKCSYDHHGLCQEHHLRTDMNGNPECEVKLLVDAVKKAGGTQQ